MGVGESEPDSVSGGTGDPESDPVSTGGKSVGKETEADGTPVTGELSLVDWPGSHEVESEEEPPSPPPATGYSRRTGTI